MIGHIPELIESGVASFKIEGRMKSAYYTAVVTNAYRQAIDAYLSDPGHYVFDARLSAELDSVSHREYGTGFYFDEPMENAQTVSQCGYLREKSYFAIAEAPRPFPNPMIETENPNGKLWIFRQMNKMNVWEDAEYLTAGKTGERFFVRELYDAEGHPISSTPHAGMQFWCRVPYNVTEGDILRASDAKGLEIRAADRKKNG